MIFNKENSMQKISKYLIWLKISALIFLLTPRAVFAQEDTDLEKRIEALERKLEEHKDKKKGLHILNNIRFAALVQMDANIYDGAFNADAEGRTGSDVFVRRVHLRMFHKLNDQWDYILLLLADDDTTRFLVGFARYQLDNKTEFRLGKIKEDRSFSVQYIGEELTGERPMVVNAFATAFQWGAQAHRLFDPGFRISAGVFKDRKFSSERDGLDENNALTLGYNTRLTWSHLNDDTLLHLGGSYGLREISGDSFILSTPADVWRARPNLDISPELDSADEANIYMTEVVAQKGALRFESEYGFMDVKSSSENQDDLSLSGYYLGLHYFLDGKTQQSYNRKYAKFGRPTNENNVWEVYTRLSVLDLVDNSEGTKAEVAMIGATYFLNPHIHFQLQYYDAEVSGPGVNFSPFTRPSGDVLSDGRAITARFSYRF